MDPRKAELIQTIRARRAKLDDTLGALDTRVTELAQLPARVRAEVRRIGRWTAIVVGVSAVTLASVLLVRALVRPRHRALGRGRR